MPSMTTIAQNVLLLKRAGASGKVLRTSSVITFLEKTPILMQAPPRQMKTSTLMIDLTLGPKSLSAISR